MTERQTSTASDMAPCARARPLFGLLALCYAVAYLAWLHFGGASTALRDLASELVFLPFNVALVAFYLRASRSTTLSSGMRRALRLLAMAGTIVLFGNLISLYGLLTAGRSPLVSVADLCYLADYPLTLGALLSIPVAGRRSDRWKFVCDAGMVLAGGGVAMWYFVVRPTAASAATEPITVTLALVYPLADLLILVGIVTLLLRRPADGNRRAIGWLSAGTVLSVLADLMFNLVRAENGKRGASWADALYLATYVALLVGAELFWRDPRPAETPREPARIGRLVSALPFAAAGATYALLLVIALRQWVAPLSGVAIGAIAVSLFLGARQLLAFRQSATIAAETAVRTNEARFRSLVQHSSDLIFLLGPEGIIQFASSSASRLIGYEPDALVGVALSVLAHPDDAALVGAFVDTSARLPGVSPPVEWRLRRPDGSVVHVEAIASNLLADDAVRGVVLNARDVGERKVLLDQLAHQAFHDPLTGLANRALFRDRVTHALALARREQRTVTVLYLDLDDFKQVNDTMGHAEGDQLLTMIAARLRACARTTDTVARLGGDEFAVLVEDTADVGSAGRLIERIREQMAYPFTLGGGDVSVTTSIGSAVAVDDCAEELLRRADLAMYSAKRSERGGHRAAPQSGAVGQAIGRSGSRRVDR